MDEVSVTIDQISSNGFPVTRRRSYALTIELYRISREVHRHAESHFLFVLLSVCCVDSDSLFAQLNVSLS